MINKPGAEILAVAGRVLIDGALAEETSFSTPLGRKWLMEILYAPIRSSARALPRSFPTSFLSVIRIQQKLCSLSHFNSVSNRIFEQGLPPHYWSATRGALASPSLSEKGNPDSEQKASLLPATHILIKDTGAKRRRSVWTTLRHNHIKSAGKLRHWKNNGRFLRTELPGVFREHNSTLSGN